jgi:hypothetical protein
MQGNVANMFNQLRRLIFMAVLIALSMLYYAERLSQASEHQRSFAPTPYNEPVEPTSSELPKGLPKEISKEIPREEEKAFHPLKDLCSKSKWTEGLWLHCHSYCGENKTSACGGLNNARNRIQTCLRLAIDAGAGVIIPSVTFRNEDNLANTNFSTACADRFWNMEHLQESLARSCSQLKLRVCDDRRGIKHVITTRERNYAQASYTNGAFRPFVETALEIAGFNMIEFSAENSAAVSYGDTLIAWDYHASGELGTIRKALFKTLKFNQDLLALGSRIYQSPILRDGNYVGVHFRGEKDWPAEFGSAAHQMKFYTEELLKIKESVSYDLKTVYISVSLQDHESLEQK